ncbi:MAG: pilin [Candidatus Moraniibacteriota bacterium]
MKYNIKIKNLFFFGLIAIIFCLPIRKVMATNVCGTKQPFGTCQMWCSSGYIEDTAASQKECAENTMQTTCCIQDATFEDNSSSDICMDASGIEGICEYGDCTTGTTKLNSSDCKGNWIDTTCCGIVGLKDNPTPLPSSEYDCSDIANDSSRTPVGKCQHGACPAGSTTLAVSECSDNWWDKTCCKFIMSPSATSLSGLTSNPTNNSSGGGTNVNNSNGTTTGTSSDPITVKANNAVAYESQCDSNNKNCSTDNDRVILANQCQNLFTSAECVSMSTYLNSLTNKCLQMKPTGIDCSMISSGGYYGNEASKFASYYINNTKSGSGASGAGGLDFDSIARTGIPDSPNVKVVLVNIVSWMLEILGLITFIAFIISGGQYLMASGNDKMIETAKKNMTYSIIGIIVALSGFVIIRAVDMALRATSRLF